MKKFIFLLLNLLQVYVSFPYPEYKTDLRGGCPEPDYSQDCDCMDDNTGLDTCKGGDICCFDYWCGKYICQPPQPICPPAWHPGGCVTSTPPGPNDTCDQWNDSTDCPPNQQCCDNGCIFECLFPEHQCPIEDDSECDGITLECDPNIIGNCPIGELCCLIDCVYDCIVPKQICPEPSVTCPTTAPTSTVPYEICFYYNNDIEECPGDELCCYNGCDDFSCIEPNYGCDYDYYFYYPGCGYESCLEEDCPNGLVCCYDGCEYNCVEPEYYRVSCPNDSIIEHEDVWTKFCLTDCNCPDYQLCCDSPCDCDLNICRDAVVQSASCPGYYDYDYYGRHCSSDEDCIGNNQLCCESYGVRQCVDPVYGPPEPSGSVVPLPLPLPSD